MSEYNILEQHDPMPLIEVLEKVKEGCEMQMYYLDESGYCSESDDYVVALAFLDDYIEKMKSKEEKEPWLKEPWGWKRRTNIGSDHIEETERDEMLGEDEQFANEPPENLLDRIKDLHDDEEAFLFAFGEVLRLARASIQPWWTLEYKNKTEECIDRIQTYYDNAKEKP